MNKPVDTIIDFITGKEIPNMGAEQNRQDVERFLVEKKGYQKSDIGVDVDIEFVVAEKTYKSQVDLVVSVNGKRVMAIKCAAGSLGSREREILAASRLLDEYQIPFSVVSDGKTATVLNTASGEKVGEGLEAIMEKETVQKAVSTLSFLPFPEKRAERERLIFRTYDSMEVNVKRKL